MRHTLAQQEDSPEQLAREISLKNAALAVEDSLQSAEAHTQQAQAQDETISVEADKLAKEKTYSIMRLIMQLQAEGKTITESKLSLLDIKERSLDTVPTSIAEQAAQEQSIESNSDLKKTIMAEKD